MGEGGEAGEAGKEIQRSSGNFLGFFFEGGRGEGSGVRSGE